MADSVVVASAIATGNRKAKRHILFRKLKRSRLEFLNVGMTVARRQLAFASMVLLQLVTADNGGAFSFLRSMPLPVGLRSAQTWESAGAGRKRKV